MSVSVDISWKSLNKHGEELCGDKVEVLKTKDSEIVILADGMGSGVKANILATLTSKILGTMFREGASIESCVGTIAKTLPVCRVREVAYATFSILQIFHNGEAYLVEFDNPLCIFVRDGKIMNYLQQTYLYPTDFDTLIYASQLLQADAIRYGVEHFRRNRGRCMGAIVWQLNDCWPVISWSSIDYCGRWKALHYAEKRFFAPLLLSCEEEGMMTQEADMNREHFTFEKSIRLNVANETREEQKVQVSWAVRNGKAKVLRHGGVTELCVPALTSVWLDKVMLPEIDVFSEYVSYELKKEGEVVSEGTVIFSYPKYFRYEDPELSWRTEGDEIVVSAAAYAKSVEIQNEAEDFVLSDNYFDLNGGEKRVKIVSGKAEGVKVRSVYDIR